MNCSECKYSKKIDYDSHLQCTVLLTKSYLNIKELKVETSEHGVKNGWCFWPFNFDPIWINSCNFYERKMLDNE